MSKGIETARLPKVGLSIRLVTAAVLFAAAVLLPSHYARAQVLVIRGAGCIGPCHGVTCCGQTVVVNENGVGLGRNFDCQAFMRSASVDQRRAFCSRLCDQGATCMEPLCEPTPTAPPLPTPAPSPTSTADQQKGDQEQIDCEELRRLIEGKEFVKGLYESAPVETMDDWEELDAWVLEKSRGTTVGMTIPGGHSGCDETQFGKDALGDCELKACEAHERLHTEKHEAEAETLDDRARAEGWSEARRNKEQLRLKQRAEIEAYETTIHYLEKCGTDCASVRQ